MIDVKEMKGNLVIFTCSLFLYCSVDGEPRIFPGFFVPEEVQTILQLVYSRLPPTRIGSDHRFGVGFRIGNNADAQILVELGPQSATQPLGDNPRKRESGQRKYTTEDKRPGKKTAENKAASNKTTDNKIVHSKTADVKVADEKRGNGNTTAVITSVDKKPAGVIDKRTIDRRATGIKTDNFANNTEESNSLKSQEPFLNMFMKWLTRLSQARNDSVKKKKT